MIFVMQVNFCNILKKFANQVDWSYYFKMSAVFTEFFTVEFFVFFSHNEEPDRKDGQSDLTQV